MFGIGQFFEKFKSRFAREILVKTTVQAAVKSQTGIEIPLESILKRSNEVVLSGLSSGARSVIFIKKQNILRDLNGHDSLKHIKDIIF